MFLHWPFPPMDQEVQSLCWDLVERCFSFHKQRRQTGSFRSFGLLVYALIAKPDGTNLFAGTGEEGIFRSTDNGTTWNSANSGIPQYTSVHSFAANGINLFAGTWLKGVFLSTNNGESWSPSGLSDKIVFALFATPDGMNLFAGTWEEGIFSFY